MMVYGRTICVEGMGPRYRKRLFPVEAVRVTALLLSDRNRPDWLKAAQKRMEVYVEPFNTMVDSGYAFTVRTPEGERQAHVGDFLIMDIEGNCVSLEHIRGGGLMDMGDCMEIDGYVRAEAAARLRKQAETRSSNEALLWQRLEVAVRGLWASDMMLDEMHMHYQEVFAKLADMIDPRALPCGMDSLGRPPYYTGHLHVNDSVDGCSVCGYPYGKEIYKLPGRLPRIPNYCPCCGARVVMADGR